MRHSSALRELLGGGGLGPFVVRGGFPFLNRNGASCSSVWSAHGNVGTHTAGAFLVCVPRPEMPPIAHARG